VAASFLVCGFHPESESESDVACTVRLGLLSWRLTTDSKAVAAFWMWIVEVYPSLP
jgi:hypothetical protein